MNNKPSWIMIVVLAIMAFACAPKDDIGGGPSSTSGNLIITVDCPGELDATGTKVYAEEEITFHVHVEDPETGGASGSVENLRFAFRIYSPDDETVEDDISWTTTSVEPSVEVIDKLDPDPDIAVFEPTGSGEDKVYFQCETSSGTSFDSNFDMEVMTFTIGPIPATYKGREICIDMTDVPPDNLEWYWESSGHHGTPIWSGTLCYEIGDIRPLDVSLELVNGEPRTGTVESGREIEFYIQMNNTTTYTFETFDIGFKVFPGDENSSMYWVGINGNPTAELEAVFGDIVVLEINSTPGVGIDTIGFSPSLLSSGTVGLIPGYSEISFIVKIGPIDESFEGESICIDKSDFEAESGAKHPWMWIIEGAEGDDQYYIPTWHEEPQCFEIVSPE